MVLSVSSGKHPFSHYGNGESKSCIRGEGGKAMGVGYKSMWEVPEWHSCARPALKE